jgi:hypothetical protein
MSNTSIKITSEKLRLDECYEFVTDDSCGGIVAFVGTVRNTTQSKEVTQLDFSTYKPMAIKEMNHIAELELKYRVLLVSGYFYYTYNFRKNYHDQFHHTFLRTYFLCLQLLLTQKVMDQRGAYQTLLKQLFYTYLHNTLSGVTAALEYL